MTESGSKGTTISVRDLFFNTPARLKFMRQAATERARITELVGYFIVAYPDICFRLISNDRVALSSQGSGDLFDCVVRIMGRDISKALVPVGFGESNEQIAILE